MIPVLGRRPSHPSTTQNDEIFLLNTPNNNNLPLLETSMANRDSVHHNLLADHQLLKPISAKEQEDILFKKLDSTQEEETRNNNQNHNNHDKNNDANHNNNNDHNHSNNTISPIIELESLSSDPPIKSVVENESKEDENYLSLDPNGTNKEIQDILSKVNYNHKRVYSNQNNKNNESTLSVGKSSIISADFVLNFPERFRFCWDWLILCTACYTIFQLPLVAFFRPELTSVVGLIIVDYLVDLLYLTDLIFQFNSSYMSEWGIMITQRKQIRYRYLHGNFLYDFISLIPLELIFGLSTGYQLGSRGIALLRLIRIFRVHRFVTSERLQSSGMVLFRLFRLLVALFILVHYIGALFFGIGIMQTEGNDVTGDPWVVQYNLNEADLSTQYVNSMYWTIVTILTVGYGDITPKTNLEKFYTCLVIMVGAVFYAIVFGNIALLIQNLDISRQRYRDKLDSLEEFIKIYKVPNKLASEIRSTHKALWQIHKGIEMNQLIDQLPPSQRTATRMFLHQQLVQKLDWFQNVSLDFIETLVTRLTTEIYLRGEFIFKQGELPAAMYFISRGRVKIYNENFSISQGENTYFGEIGLVIDTRRTASVITLEHCEVCVLSKEDFFEVLNMFPNYAREVLITAHKRHKQGDKKINNNNNNASIDMNNNNNKINTDTPGLINNTNTNNTITSNDTDTKAAIHSNEMLPLKREGTLRRHSYSSKRQQQQQQQHQINNPAMNNNFTVNEINTAPIGPISSSTPLEQGKSSDNESSDSNSDDSDDEHVTATTSGQGLNNNNNTNNTRGTAASGATAIRRRPSLKSNPTLSPASISKPSLAAEKLNRTLSIRYGNFNPPSPIPPHSNKNVIISRNKTMDSKNKELNTFSNNSNTNNNHRHSIQEEINDPIHVDSDEDPLPSVKKKIALTKRFTKRNVLENNNNNHNNNNNSNDNNNNNNDRAAADAMIINTLSELTQKMQQLELAIKHVNDTA